MGFLEVGEPIDWPDSLDVIGYIREHGIQQFLNLYNRVKAIEGDSLLWGDEVEYAVLSLDETESTARLSLRGAEILAELKAREEQSHPEMSRYERCAWVPEYGSWMVEGTPATPYSGFAIDLLRVERNMRVRRARLNAALRPGEIAPTIPCFPMMGVGTFTAPAHPPGGPIAQSLFVPDAVINPHPRFGALTRNIRSRRGERVDIRLPRFRDAKTPAAARPAGGPPPSTAEEALQMEEVYMDAMAFGMGCCCLQVTFQARDVSESRHLYDQLAVLSPILMALTAATPIARGVLLDTDARWDLIAASVDCRTPAERGDADTAATGATYDDRMAGGGRRRLPKSRYASISCYIADCNARRATKRAGGEDGVARAMSNESDCGGCSDHAKTAARDAQYNDIEAPYDEAAYAQLVAGGVDATLARHVAHLFVRDPLVIFRGRVDVDDATQTDHFENLQSTNWQTVRWKPPPAKPPSHIGWRTEFRSMEVQMTDFENAAFTVFVVLASRVILYYNLNLLLPLSKVDENMRRAHARDALATQKFHFRSSLRPASEEEDGAAAAVEMTASEVLMGNGKAYKGLVPMIMAYLDRIGADGDTTRAVSSYMEFIALRASGELLTPAAWMRAFVRKHPDYQQDSVVPPRAAADLLKAAHRIGLGLERCPEMHGDFPMPPIATTDAYAVPLRRDPSRKLGGGDLDALVDSYAQRTELLARRRKLQAEVARAQKELAAMQCELQAIDTAIADSIAASPPASPHDGDASGHPRFSNGGGAKRNGEPSRPSPLGGGESPRKFPRAE